MAEVAGVVAGIAGLIQITGLVASAAYGYIGSVTGAKKEIKRLLDELNSFESVLKQLQSTPAYTDASASSVLTEPIRTCLTEMCELHQKLALPKNKQRDFSRNCKWPLQEKETMTFVTRIERQKSLFHLALSYDQYCILRAVEVFSQNADTAIGDLVESLKKESITLRRPTQQEVVSRAGKKRATVLNWFYPDTVNQRHNEISSRRQDNTGKWLLHDPQFEGWVQGDGKKRLLCGYGIRMHVIVYTFVIGWWLIINPPNSWSRENIPSVYNIQHQLENSYMTLIQSRSLVIEELESLASMKNYGLAYIYFNFKEQEQQTPSNVLGSLIKQLLTQTSERKLPSAVEHLYDRLKPRGEAPTIDDLQQALVSTSSLFPRVFLIFDALDECDEKTHQPILLQFLHKLSLNGASVFLTSRPYTRDIIESLKSDIIADIELAAKEEDIQIYVEESIDKNFHAKALIQGKLRGNLISKFIECCNGMFLAAYFHIEDLCQYTTTKEVSVALGELATSFTTDQPLYRIYNRAIEKIRLQHESRVTLANKVLLWLAKTKRVLTVDELRLAVSVEQTDKSPPSEEDMPDAVTLVEVCAGLVIIDDISNTVRLAHYSVQEYLFEYSLISPNPDLEIATCCITYLLFDTFTQYHNSKIEALATHSFLSYVGLSLDSHLQLCSEESSAEIYLRLLRAPGALRLYQKARDKFNSRLDPTPSQLYPPYYRHIRRTVGHSPLLEASRVGNSLALRTLLGEGHIVSAKTREGVTALQIAAGEGHESVIRVLLDNHLSTESRDNAGWTPLFEAACQGRDNSVRVLLENGASPTATAPTRTTPLHIAASHGYEAIVRSLLKAGADINAKDSFGTSPLHAATERGINKMVTLLLDEGADISAVDSGRTLLHMLLQRSDFRLGDCRVKELVQSLLDRGVDVSAMDDDGRTSLYYAVLGGEVEAVQLLLEKGADVSAVVLDISDMEGLLDTDVFNLLQIHLKRQREIGCEGSSPVTESNGAR